MPRSLSVAIQMDPIGSIDVATDTTYMLGLEAQRRGYRLHYYTPDRLSLSGSTVVAHTQPLTLHRDSGHYYDLGPVERTDLSTMDVVLLRQDPPFNMQYISTCHLLERIHPNTLVVNNPSEVRNCPEKLFPLHWPELTPPTLISRDAVEIAAFLMEHRAIVLKPLYMFGGEGVEKLSSDSPRAAAQIADYLATQSEPVVAQRFLPEVVEGDTRILLVDGVPIGALRRVPQQGSIRSNLHSGGEGQKSTLTPRMRDICAAIGPELKKRGLLFVGIDIIGDYLTEINVTSPTCLQEINALDDVTLERIVWDAIEGKL